jgi:hypothetical protein
MISNGTLSALITILAAALIGFVPMTSCAVDYTPDSPTDLSSDSRSNSTQCSSEPSPNLSGCATADMDRTAKIIKVMPTVGGDYPQPAEQIDVTRALLEDLIKTAPK